MTAPIIAATETECFDKAALGGGDVDVMALLKGAEGTLAAFSASEMATEPHGSNPHGPKEVELLRSLSDVDMNMGKVS